MMKIKKIISIISVLTFFLLFSISPVLADEASGSAAEGTGTSEQSAGDSAESAENDVLDVIVPITEGTIDVSEESAVPAAPSTDGSAESADNDVLDVVVPITSGETIDIVEDSAATNEAVQSGSENYEYLSSDVLNVIVPITVAVTIDPLELAGKGQIYSNTYNIANYGETDVLLTFNDIQVTFADDINFEAVAEPFNERVGSKLKSIFMMLDFGRDDVPPAVITDPNQLNEISIPLTTAQSDTADTSLVQFNFTGNVNENPAQNWQDGDVKISLTYTLTPVLPPEEITPPAIEVTPTAVEIPTPAEEVTTPEGQVTTPEEQVTTPEEQAATPEDQMTTPEDQVTTPAEEVTTPEEQVTTPEEQVTAPTEQTSPNTETVDSTNPSDAPVSSETTASS